VVVQHQPGVAPEQGVKRLPREVAGDFIRHVAKSRLHLRLIRLLATKHLDVVSIKTLAKTTGESQAALFKPLHDLAKAGILKGIGQGTAYNYAPSPERTAQINAFLGLWTNPKWHSELLSMILTSERRGMR
jgi:hypothetical protein